MKTMYFENFDKFEESETAVLYEVISIVKNETFNTMCADLMTDCKSYKTALNRFFKGLEGYPQFTEWKDALIETCENGCFSDSEKYWDEETFKYEYKGGWHYSIEDNDGSYYICLNVSC
jgi:hypothetical protein